MGKFLYEQNETIKLVGHRKINADYKAKNRVMEIVNAYADTEDDEFEVSILKFIKHGYMANFIMDIYALGVINGKREERARRKQHRNKRK